MSINIKPRWAKLLTIGQIVQMIVGIVVICWYFVKIYSRGETCHCLRPDLLAISCILMYGSYLFLFIRFYIGRYSNENQKKE
jgi:elongation of very long chain fatty acids protein 6